MSIASIIKYEGDNSTFIWKHPRVDFNNLSQLIVHESQEAAFYMNGQVLDVFGPGRHTLETQNIPKLGQIIKTLTGRSPFHCEVYYINKTVQMAIKWGTDSKVHFLEPTYKVPLEIGASGEMNLMVSDPIKLLVKLVGTMNGIAWDDRKGGFTKSLSASFRPLIVNSVKTCLASCIKSNNINILEIDEHLSQLSAALKDAILPGFEEYGLTIPEFYVNSISLPENDPNFKKIVDLHGISLQHKVIEAQTAIKTATIDAETAIKIARAESDANVAAVQRQAILAEEITATEAAKLKAERDIIRTQVDAQKIRASGLAEAEVMRAKGYTEKDVIQGEVQKAYADSLGKMNININGGVGGTLASDMLGIGLGIPLAGTISNQVNEMFGGLGRISGAQTTQNTITCPNPSCGKDIAANSKFCPICGTKIENLAENEMICPHCNKKTPKGKFCMECGESIVTKCTNCQADMPYGAKFCLECGQKL